jgi:hypothetical protein
MKGPRPQAGGVPTWLQHVGDALQLQLLFVLVSLPIFTVLPAAVALQRCLPPVLTENGTRGISRLFFGELIRAWRRYWPFGLLLPLIAAMALLSILFWLAADPFPGLLVLAIIVPLVGLGCAYYLAFLAAAGSSEPDAHANDVRVEAVRIMGQRPLQHAVGVLALIAWSILLVFLPTLALLGSGLVPGLISWVAARGIPSAQTVRDG